MDSTKYYRLNSNFGDVKTEESTTQIEDLPFVSEVPQSIEKVERKSVHYDNRRKVLEGRI